MPFDSEDWHQWRGATDERMNAIEHHAAEQTRDLETVKAKVGDILVKLAVPLFLTSMVGVVAGGLIVFLLTNAIRH